jgi:hypothetical protein
LLFFLVVDDGWVSFTHLLPVGVVSAVVLGLACFSVCSLVVVYCASTEQLDLLFFSFVVAGFLFPFALIEL